MKDKYFKSVIFLIVIIVVGLFLAPFIYNITKSAEGFSGLYELTNSGIFPKSVDQVILDDYPKIGKN